MNQSLKTIGLSVLAGFAGAYLFGLTGLQQPAAVSELGLATSAQQGTGQSAEAFAIADQGAGRSLAELPNFSDAATASTPSVVYIKTMAVNQRPVTWFDMFFDNEGRYERVTGSGSGVIFSKDGYIVTNNHVISGASDIEVIHNKRTYKAQMVGTDPSTDLALLKVEANNLPAVKVTSSETVKVGDWVLAVGNPFNLTSTVTAGIVSAKGRSINILSSQFPIESFIQTDAAINPGNSGGALVNAKGELVGINTAILSRTGSYTGYGFAVPSDIVMKIVADLRNHGQVQKAFIGVEVTDVTEELYQKLNLDAISGVIITRVDNGSAAEKAGLERGDVLLKINGKAIDSKTAYDEQMSYYRPGDNIVLHLKREGKPVEKTVRLTNLDGTTTVYKREIYRAEKIGADLEAVPKAERAKLGIESGVRIVKAYGGLMRQIGLPEGFIITAINNRQISGPEELESIMERLRGSVVIKGATKEGVPKEFYLY